MNNQVKVIGMYQNTFTDWLYENGIEGYSIWVSAWNNHPYSYMFEFLNEEDAVAFKLKWI